MTKLKIAGSALLVAAITAPLLIQHHALTKLREENRQLRIRSEDGLAQNKAITPYHAAETWANVGYEEPLSAVITFFWALRTGNQAGYSGAFGRDMPLEDAWSDAFRSVKGSFLSKPTPLPNGDVRVSVAHETTNGDIATTLITYRQKNGQWLIRSMAGFPTAILDASSATASYGPPAIQSSSP